MMGLIRRRPCLSLYDSHTRLLNGPSQGHVTFGSCDLCGRRSYGVAHVDEDAVQPHVLHMLPVTVTNRVMLNASAN